MKRVSLGIILPGDPDRVQKQTIGLKITTFICTRGWILTLLITIFMVIKAFKLDSGNLLSNAMKPAFATVALAFLAFVVWSQIGRCPYCKHFGTMHKISEDSFIGSSERNVSRTAYDHHSGFAFDSDGNSAYYSGISSRREHGKEVTEEYTYNMRCSCCGCVNKVKKARTFRNY